mmetsp:Transcript_5865/g.23168  ORF Transcript_5865/g.23168 Transcript_5865/m.23168 type:complete len:223 (+) Transcript_5865:3080-3748(+)
MPSIIRIAASRSASAPPVTNTISFSLLTSMFSAPVFSMMERMVSPPLPMTLPKYFSGTAMEAMRGAYLLVAPAGAGSHFSISPRMCTSPFCASSSAVFMTSIVIPSTLISIWNAVIPSLSPATLKSMSPSASSEPKISVRTMGSSSSPPPAASEPKIKPMAIPATFLLIGTPASSKASVPAQTVAIDEEPLLSVIVLSSLHTKGKSSSDGRMGMSARSAKFP